MARALVFLSNKGQDPTEVVTPVMIFQEAGIQVDFATEDGKPAECDPRMVSGIVGALLGATKKVKEQYFSLILTPAWTSPHAWSSSTFSLSPYDLVLLPGGHDKSLHPYLSSPTLHAHLAAYFPLISRAKENPETGEKRKVLLAICHGVLTLARTMRQNDDEKSVLYECKTTTLPYWMERSISLLTYPFLGTYYRTYPQYTSTEVSSYLKNPKEQYKDGGWMMSGFVVEDEESFYASGRFPGDAQELGERGVKWLKQGGIL